MWSETTRVENRGETTRGETTRGGTSWGPNVLLPSTHTVDWSSNVSKYSAEEEELVNTAGISSIFVFYGLCFPVNSYLSQLVP